MPADGSSALVAGGTPFSLWLGPEPREAAAAYRRARDAGLTPARALVVGQIGSYRDCWRFRKSIARVVGTSVRTVQRAISQAKALGLIGVARCKKGEIAPGMESENPEEPPRLLPCGWSHRWTIGWGRTGKAVQKLIEVARLRFVARASISATRGARRVVTAKSSPSTPSPGGVRRELSQEQIDRELAELGPHVSARVRAMLEDRWRRKPRDGPT